MIPAITYNLESLRAACVQYGKLSDKTESEVISKQSAKLSWNIWEGLRALMPAKGSTRAERLAVLEAGGGLKIRPSIRDAIEKKYGARLAKGQKNFGKAGLNVWQLAVNRELNVRESGRGFLAFSTPRPTSRNQKEETANRDLVSKYGETLSNFSLQAQESAEHKVALLRWLDHTGGQYQAPNVGLMQPRQQEVIAQQIAATTLDVNEYILRKLRENAAEAFKL